MDIYEIKCEIFHLNAKQSVMPRGIVTKFRLIFFNVIMNMGVNKQ